MSFRRTLSKAYYDSTIALCKKMLTGTKISLAKKIAWDVLVGTSTPLKHKIVYWNEAAMDSSTRNDFIKKMIKKIEEGN